MGRKIVNIFLALIITLFFLLPYLSLRKIENERDIQRNKVSATQRIDDISQKLVEEINMSLEYVDILDVIVRSNPSNIETVETYTEMILEKHDCIENIDVAPDGVVQYIYPVGKSDIAIGHDLINDPQRYPYIKKAIDERSTVIQGPVEAIQGGKLIFTRKAIFMTENGQERFWGVCVVTINFDKLMANSGITLDDEEYLLALNVPAVEEESDFFWGDSTILTKDSISHPISIGDQEWELFIYPKIGWTDNERNWFGIEAADGLYVQLSIILFVFVLLHLNRYAQQAEAAKVDFLTGTLNKNTFKKYVVRNLKKKKNRQALIIIDINKFKAINDTYGHLAGDRVIKEMAHRLTKVLRGKELVSRWGGDEFVVYVDDLESLADIEKIIKRIHREVADPFQTDEALIHVDISTGYACYPDDGTRYQELYKKADHKMYANKALSEETQSSNLYEI